MMSRPSARDLTRMGTALLAARDLLAAWDLTGHTPELRAELEAGRIAMTDMARALYDAAELLDDLYADRAEDARRDRIDHLTIREDQP